MDWTRQIDAYCERLGPAFWAEPINALTNLAFVIVAIWMWRRTQGAARALSAVLFAIGLGSFLFHTFATPWAALADVVPIAVFVLTYLYLVNRAVLGWPIWGAALGTTAYFPYAAGVMTVLNTVPFLAVSNVYWTVPLLLVIYAVLLWRRHPATARGFAFGAALLALSISARSLDANLCEAWPIGTHFIWHCLNAAMLGWMIEVYRCHTSASS